MKSTPATSRPKVRLTTVAAAIAILAAAGRIATADSDLVHLHTTMLIALMAGAAVSLAGILTERQADLLRYLSAIVERQDRATAQLTRMVVARRVYGRDDDVLESAMLREIRSVLAEMRQIREHHTTIAAALDANNDRWERKRGEAYANGYKDGMRGRGPGGPPTLRSV